MSYFLKIPITKSELDKWTNNKSVNPRTNRKITKNGKIYQYFEKELNKIDKLNLFNVSTNEEPIMFEKFFDETENKLLVDETKYLIWKESSGRIMALHYKSLLGLQKAKINTHPITRNIIPNSVFTKANEINKNVKSINSIEPIETIESLALRTFQYFNNLCIYIDNKDYVNLPSNKITVLKNELYSFYNENLSQIQKNQFKKKKFFCKNSKRDILLDIIYLMDNVSEKDKIFVSYLILGGLILVLPKLKKNYPFLEFSF